MQYIRILPPGKVRGGTSLEKTRVLAKLDLRKKMFEDYVRWLKNPAGRQEPGKKNSPVEKIGS